MMITVRDGKKIWPCCKTCGCRLQIMSYDSFWSIFHGIRTLRHFYGTMNTDARGCKCSDYEEGWSIDSEKLDFLGV